MENPTNKALTDKYRRDNQVCELAWCRWIPVRAGRPSEINHIFSVHRRWDLLSNIIHLSNPIHTWFHRWPIEGRILCMLVKARKKELDPDEIKKASGFNPLGWLESVRDETRLEWIGPYADELDELLQEMEGGR